MSPKKRNILIVVVLLCVCAAVYLNWSYNNQNSDDALSNSALAGEKSAEEQTVSSNDDYVTEYFAKARLTRQQSRDKAMDLLEQAASSETASKETIDGAMDSISAMANYSMEETQIENLIMAKNFADCVAFISADGITLAVPAPADGLVAEDVAKITDTIISETNYTAAQLKIIEVKTPAPGASAMPMSPVPTASAVQSPAPSPSASSAVSPAPKTGTGTSGAKTSTADSGETAITDVELD